MRQVRPIGYPDRVIRPTDNPDSVFFNTLGRPKYIHLSRILWIDSQYSALEKDHEGDTLTVHGEYLISRSQGHYPSRNWQGFEFSVLKVGDSPISSNPRRTIWRDQQVHDVVASDRFHFGQLPRSGAVITVEPCLCADPQESLRVLSHTGHGDGAHRKLLF